MKIYLCTGRGEGPTPLAAFDAALLDAGIGNHNLIYLSSVIPPDSEIVRQKYNQKPREYGHRMYAVLSQQRVEELGQEAWAGLGWVQNPKDNRGLFVELHGHSALEVERSIHATLKEMKANRSEEYGNIQHELSGIECSGQPACAIVAAVYEINGWKQQADN